MKIYTGAETVTLDQAIQLLNDLLALDRVTMTRLLLTRYPVAPAVANHPATHVVADRDRLEMGTLGLLNALFGKDVAGKGGMTVIPNGKGTIETVVRTQSPGAPATSAAVLQDATRTRQPSPDAAPRPKARRTS